MPEPKRKKPSPLFQALLRHREQRLGMEMLRDRSLRANLAKIGVTPSPMAQAVAGSPAARLQRKVTGETQSQQLARLNKERKP